MGDRTTLGAGAVYCGVFPLLLYTAYATFYMRQDVMPALPPRLAASLRALMGRTGPDSGSKS